jgi:hypothetical protein
MWWCDACFRQALTGTPAGASVCVRVCQNKDPQLCSLTHDSCHVGAMVFCSCNLLFLWACQKAKLSVTYQVRH